MSTREFIVTTSVTELEKKVLGKLSSVSGSTMATVIRALIRSGLEHYSDLKEPYLLQGLTYTGKSTNSGEHYLKKILEKVK